MLTTLSQFGAAGLMGVLWIWERSMSRRRETQLDAAHRRLMRRQREIGVLMKLVADNTRAMERFEQTQRQLLELLERMHDEMHETSIK